MARTKSKFMSDLQPLHLIPTPQRTERLVELTHCCEPQTERPKNKHRQRDNRPVPTIRWPAGQNHLHQPCPAKLAPAPGSPTSTAASSTLTPSAVPRAPTPPPHPQPRSTLSWCGSRPKSKRPPLLAAWAPLRAPSLLPSASPRAAGAELSAAPSPTCCRVSPKPRSACTEAALLGRTQHGGACRATGGKAQARDRGGGGRQTPPPRLPRWELCPRAAETQAGQTWRER